LQKWKVAAYDVSVEWKLILLRCGLFDVDDAYSDKTICPAHRYKLGFSSGAASASMSQAIQPGWARKMSKARKRFSQQVKDFLLAQFMVGVDTGKKENPEIVSRRFKSQFQRDDWLTAQQIASYFSRLAALHKSGTLPSKSWTDVTNNAVELVERQLLVDAVQKQCDL